ncbi:MAG: acyltransferase [Paludibacter sp.]|nr:acyltransferase [Paludibacter sp.]
MKLKYLIQQSYFVIKIRFFYKINSTIRKIWYVLQGMNIGKNTYIPKIHVTWPHQVSIGENCILEHDIYFKFDGIWSNGPTIIIEDNVFIGAGCEFNIKEKVVIRNNCLIASGVRFVDHDHGLEINILMKNQPGQSGSIIINEDVWIGCNVVVLKDVSIGKGAVVAAGAVVTKSIPMNEIWGGVPAKKIGERK